MENPRVIAHAETQHEMAMMTEETGLRKNCHTSAHPHLITTVMASLLRALSPVLLFKYQSIVVMYIINNV